MGRGIRLADLGNCGRGTFLGLVVMAHCVPSLLSVVNEVGGDESEDFCDEEEEEGVNDGHGERALICIVYMTSRRMERERKKRESSWIRAGAEWIEI